MDWPLAALLGTLVLLTAILVLRVVSAWVTLQTRKLRAEEERWARMNALNKRSTAARRKGKKKQRDEDEEEDEEEDEGDEIDQLFDVMDRSPMVAGVVQGIAQKEGVDLAQIEARNPMELLKAKKVLDKLGQQVLGDGTPAAAAGGGYL